MTAHHLLSLVVAPAVLLLAACGSTAGTPIADDRPAQSQNLTTAAEPTATGQTVEESTSEEATSQESTSQESTSQESSSQESTEPTTRTSEQSGVVTADQIVAAQDGLARWLAANRPATPQTSTDIPGCPAMELEVLQAALDERGLTDPIEDWATEVEWDEYEDLDPELMGIACGGDSDGDANDSGTDGTSVGLAALDLGDVGWTAFLETTELSALPATTLPSLPGDAVADCLEDMCLVVWHAEQGLMLALMVEGPTLTAADVEEMLQDWAPGMLTALAAV